MVKVQGLWLVALDCAGCLVAAPSLSGHQHLVCCLIHFVVVGLPLPCLFLVLVGAVVLVVMVVVVAVVVGLLFHRLLLAVVVVMAFLVVVMMVFLVVVVVVGVTGGMVVGLNAAGVEELVGVSAVSAAPGFLWAQHTQTWQQQGEHLLPHHVHLGGAGLPSGWLWSPGQVVEVLGKLCGWENANCVLAVVQIRGFISNAFNPRESEN